MTAPSSPSTRPDPTRSGAVWVTGLGGFLLLAAAAVFTAVHWEQVPDAAKLGALMLATGACLVAGRGLRTSLPATAATLFHLGTFLVPVDVAAIALHRDLAWGGILLAEGIVAAIAFAWASATEDSVVLRWGFRASVVVLAGGIAATTAVPAPLALAAAAVVALLIDREADALTWAGLAGAAPLLASLDSLTRGAGTLERLGLTGDPSRATAAITGLGAAAVLATVAHRRRHVALGVTSLVVCGLGILTSWTSTGATPEVNSLALAAAFLVIELLALLTVEDRFWRQPTRLIAQVAEVPATLTVASGLIVGVVATWFDTPADVTAALGFAALAAGWLAAAQRRPGPATGSVLAVAVSAAAAAAFATAGGPWFVAALLAIGAVAVLTDQPAAGLIAPVAALLAAGAALTALDEPSTVGVLAVSTAGVVGSLLVGEAAVRRSRRSTGPDDQQTALDTVALALTSLLPGAVVMVGLIDLVEAPATVLVGAVVGATALAIWLDRAPSVRGPIGTIARVAAVTPALVAASMGLRPQDVAAVALVAVACSAVDAVRLRQPLVALGAAAMLPLAVVTMAEAAGLSTARAGVAAAVAAMVVAGAGASIDRRWLVPVAVAVGSCAGVGAVLAFPEPTALADVLMLLGGLGLAGSIERQRVDGMAVSGLVITGGIWLRLAAAEVTALEPYLLPVAALLLLAGLRARRTGGASSWIAYGPAIGLFGGAALAERLGGGDGWHAVVAGAVGVIAVVTGGQRRLAAPLLLGTGLLVVLAGYETLAITAGFPTWVWLALGGATLLAAGVAMERHDVGPLETGKRLVDVVQDKYA